MPNCLGLPYWQSACIKFVSLSARVTSFKSAKCHSVSERQANPYRVSLKNALLGDWHPWRPKTIHRVGDHSKMLSNTICWSGVPIYPFSDHLWMVFPQMVFPKLKGAVITRSKWQMAQNVPSEKHCTLD